MLEHTSLQAALAKVAGKFVPRRIGYRVVAMAHGEGHPAGVEMEIVDQHAVFFDRRPDYTLRIELPDHPARDGFLTALARLPERSLLLDMTCGNSQVFALPFGLELARAAKVFQQAADLLGFDRSAVQVESAEDIPGEPSLQGHLVVATPQLRDPNFFRAVVLMIRHGDEGAFGLVLNRPTEMNIQQVWHKVSETPCARSDSLRLGGPVQGPLMAIHTREDCEELEILPGVYFSTEPHQLEQLVALEGDRILLFVGYAGWGPGQLESELETGSWLTLPASCAHVFAASDDLWGDVKQRISQSTVLSVAGIRGLPQDPSLN